MNLAELARIGIVARLSSGGEIILDAPAGVLTPQLLDLLRLAKTDLHKELERSGDDVNVVNIVPVCVDSAERIASRNPTSKAGASEMAITSHWWLLHTSECDPVEVGCFPDATWDEILERHPDATAAEPLMPAFRKQTFTITADEEQAVRAWLAQINETDPATIADVLERCRNDKEAGAYFLRRASKIDTGESWIELHGSTDNCTVADLVLVAPPSADNIGIGGNHE